MRFSTQLYDQRIKEHLEHADACYEEGDFVQAGEKIWGALTALLNSRYKREIRDLAEKRRLALGFVRDVMSRDSSIDSELRKYGILQPTQVIRAIFGLHEFFYGGGFDHNEEYLKGVIPVFIQLLRMM